MSAEMTAVLIGLVAALCFGGGFWLGDWRMSSRLERISNEKLVRLSGYGARNLKYGFVSHYSDRNLESAERMLREHNKESWVEQKAPAYELVELYYRKVK